MPRKALPAIFLTVDEIAARNQGALLAEDDLGLETASDVSAVCKQMYTTDTFAFEGVLHVAAVTHQNRVLKITAETPKSRHDDFVLSLARARAHFIVTTGKILREEPNLTHDYLGDETTVLAFESWRKDVAGIDEPAHVLVLTSGRDLEGAHPVFAGHRQVTVLTSADGRALLRSQSFDAANVESLNTPGLRGVIAFTREKTNGCTVAIEAGPATSSQAYQSPVAVNELLLSAFQGNVSPSLLGDAFVSRQRLADSFQHASSYEVRTGDGVWSFHRYLQ